MTNNIKIICPARKCRKCSRIVNETEAILNKAAIDFELKIISNPKEFVKYPTWILPTILVNENVVARGYTPDIKTINKHLL